VQLATLSRVDAAIAASKRRSRQIMLIFICQLGALHKTPQSLHYWTNGSVPVDTHDFRMLLLSVGDLTSGWNRERTMTKLKPPAVFEIDWQKKRLQRQSDSVDAQILSLVRRVFYDTD
jgi:hypothetical protein